jgi:DNA (cytosine-5)-methyltransferase 1
MFNHNFNKSLSNLKFIDLFCGIGAFRIALESFGAECVFSSDFDKNAQDVYENNFSERPYGDITKINENTIPKHDILCAGFPCQPFSISGKQRGFEDNRGNLFFDIARIIKKKKPSLVILENVYHFEKT